MNRQEKTANCQPENLHGPAGFARAMLLAGALFLTLLLTPVLGGADLLTWLEWAGHADMHGLVNGYAISMNEHPPLLSALFMLSIRAARCVGVADVYGIKFSFLLFLLATSAILGRMLRGNLYPLLFFHAVLLYGALCLSYMDIYTAPFLLLALHYLREEKLAHFTFFFALACLVKYPPLMLAPLLFFYLLGKVRAASDSWRAAGWSMVRVLSPALLLLVMTLAVFGKSPVDALQRAFQHYGLSANALNLGYIVQSRAWLDDRLLAPASALHGMDYFKGIILLRLPFIVFYLTTLGVFLRRPRRMDELLLYGILAHCCYFFLNIGVHENHLFLSVLLAMFLYCVKPASLDLVISLCMIYCLNLFAFYGVLGTGGLPYYSGEPLAEADLAWAPVTMYPALDLRLALAIFNVGSFLALWANCILRDGRPVFSVTGDRADQA